MLHIDWTHELAPLSADTLLVVALKEVDKAALDQRFGSGIGEALTHAKFEAKPGQSFSFSQSSPFAQVVLLGAEDNQDAASLRKLGFDAGRQARAAGVASLVLDLRDSGAEHEQIARLLSEGLNLSGYRYDQYLAEDSGGPRRLERAQVVLSGEGEHAAGAKAGAVIAESIALARDLGNGPAERVTPTFLAETATTLAEQLREAGHDVSCEVFEREECERRGMGLYLAVARGSEEPPKFIHLTYKPKGESRGRVVLIGKGVTFDSGGYSIKPTEGMLQMKLDMGGAAAVIGSMNGIAKLELPYEVHVISAAAENMVSGDAYRLGDVFRASNGKTVEINNTDAEGRLTMADALVFASSLEPDLVIDFATLTGACIVALGPHICATMTRDDALASAWLAAGVRSGEDMWRLPLPKPLMAMLDSKIADLRNTGERAGGALTAGLFLEQFTEGARWMHVDIAGPAIVGKPFGVNIEGSSGVPVATILEFLSGDLPPSSE